MLLLVEPQSTLWFGSTVRLDVINMSYFGLWRLWVVDGYSHFFQGFDNLWFLEIKWLQFTSTALIFNINPLANSTCCIDINTSCLLFFYHFWDSTVEFSAFFVRIRSSIFMFKYHSR